MTVYICRRFIPTTDFRFYMHNLVAVTQQVQSDASQASQHRQDKFRHQHANRIATQTTVAEAVFRR